MATRGVNKVILIGHLGADPEVRYMPSGEAVATLSLATSETWKDKQTGEQQERTEWHRVVLFGRLAEIAGEYLKKGRQVYIEGSLRTRKWQGQDGQDRYTTEIVAREMQLIGSRIDSNVIASGAQQQASNSEASPRNPARSQAQQDVIASKAWPPASAGKPSPQSLDDFEDDDIPF